MDAKAIVKRIRTKKELDDEWLDIRDEVLEFLESDPPEEEKRMFVPLGYLEVVTMMCDALKRKQDQ